MKIIEGKNRTIAILRYGKLARLLLGNGVGEEYIIAACKLCPDITFTTNLAIMIKAWVKYAPSERKNGILSFSSYEQFVNELNKLIEERKSPHHIMTCGDWKLGEFVTHEDCQLFPIPNRWCICKDPSWLDMYHSKNSLLFIIGNEKIAKEYQYVVAEVESNGLITFWDAENLSTDFQHFPEYTRLLPKEIKDFLFKVSLSNNPNGVYHNMTKRTNMTERRIREIIRESVDKVLNEEKKPGYGPNGYRIVKGGMDFTTDKGTKLHSAVSVANEDDTMIYHVVEDDHCYTFYVTDEGKSEQYQYPYLFDEFFEALKTLPPLS